VIFLRIISIFVIIRIFFSPPSGGFFVPFNVPVSPFHCFLYVIFAVCMVAFPSRGIGAGSAKAPVPLNFQNVSARAMDLFGINGTRANTPQYICFARCQFKMSWINTSDISAKMIELGDVLSNSTMWMSWQWLNQPCIYQPVDTFGSSFEFNRSVSRRKQAARPVPTISSGIDFNFRKDSFDISCGKGWNCEILTGSHDSSSYNELWLESGERHKRSLDLNIILQSEGMSR